MNLVEAYNEILKETPIFENAPMGDNCDCCQYFDFNSLENYDGFQNPVYFMVYKHMADELKYIKPKQYIYAIARGYGSLSYEDATSHANMDVVQQYANDMKRGDKFPIGYYYEGKASQEGRHRALALINIGCELMPIVVRRDLTAEEVRAFVIEHKDVTFEQLDAIFKEKGYKGITNLDWRDFRAYVDYKLNRE